MKKTTYCVLAAMTATALFGANAQTHEAAVRSPDGRNELRVRVDGGLSYSVWRDGRRLLEEAPMALQVRGRTLTAKLLDDSASSVQGEVKTPLYFKSSVSLAANSRRLTFEGDWGLELTARDDGVAYRFFTAFPGEETIVEGETADVRFPSSDVSLWAGYPTVYDDIEPDGWLSNWEPVYTNLTAAQAGAKTKGLVALPLVAEYADGTCLSITEADQRDYPGWLLRGSGTACRLKGVFAPEPIESKCSGRYHHDGMTRHDYLARTVGTRTYPWRLFLIAERAAKLCENDAVYALAEPSRIGPAEWVKPGLVQWEWWHDWNLTGVGFKAGKNTETYLHYIDFAAENGIPYLIMDGGWSKDYKLMNAIPEIDLKAVCAHAAKKGVALILWSPWVAFLENPEEYCRTYASIGIKGFKLDGICRNDRFLTKYLEETARIAAKYRLVIDYHGCSKPSGLCRTYPNVLTFEGVHGLENTKWEGSSTMPRCDFPKNDLTCYFCRQPAGPMDYTPGAMRNFAKDEYRHSFAEPGSCGTRVRQMALYVLYFSPLQMLCDSPSLYRKNRECLDFLRRMPTTWDETRGLGGRLAEYAAVARRKGDVWYVGAMTDWTARTLELDVAFLGGGTWRAEIFEDGVNADREATDYSHRTAIVHPTDRLRPALQPGGGFVARLTRLED